MGPAKKPSSGAQMTKTGPGEPVPGAAGAGGTVSSGAAASGGGVSRPPPVLYETSPEVAKLLARANAQPIVPPSLVDRVQLFLDLSDRLGRLMAREAEALAAGRYAEVSRITPDKQKLTVAYEEIGRLIRLDQAGTAALPAQTKAALLAATRTLRAMVNGSTDQQKVKAGAQRRLVETLVRAFNREHKEITSYANIASQTMRNPSRPPKFVTKPLPLQVSTYNAKL